MTSSVQWISTVQWMRSSGMGEYVECGPGKVLSGLTKRIDKDAVVHNIQDLATVKKVAAAMQATA